MDGVRLPGNDASFDDPLLALLVANPEMIAQVLAVHIDRSDGKCRECRGYRSREWPCVHRWYAEQAQRVVGQQRR